MIALPARRRRIARCGARAAARVTLASLVAALPLRPQDWPRFRGPDGAGLGEAALAAVPSTDDVAWSVDLPVPGQSSPVVHGGRVYVTGADESAGVHVLRCIALEDGAVLWDRTRSFEPHRKNAANGFASASPAADADGVVVLWSSGTRLHAAAYAHDGALAWERELGGWDALHGSGASPVLHDGVLLVAGDDEDEDPFLLGLDRRDGAVLWRRERARAPASFTTPLVLRRGSSTQAIFVGAGHAVTALDPQSGAIAWELAAEGQETAVASPIAAGDLLFVASKWGTLALELDARDPLAPPRERYRIRRPSTQVPTPIVVDGALFLWSDGGIVGCFDAASGAELWRERVHGEFHGSPVLAGGRLWAVSRAGELCGITAGRAFRPPVRLDLGEPSDATPACAGGRLVVRTRSRVLALGSARTARAPAPRQPSRAIVLRGARALIPDASGALVARDTRAIVTEGARVERIEMGERTPEVVRGESESDAIVLAPPPGETWTVLPGLVDADVHVEDPGELALHLRAGVTLACVPRGRPRHLEWRAEIAGESLLGPRLLVGRALPARASPAQARRRVREAAEEGYDFVTIPATLRAASWRAAAKEAAARGMPLHGAPPEREADRADAAALWIVSSVEVLAAAESEPSARAIRAALERGSARVGTGIVGFERMLRSATDLDAVLARHATSEMPPHWREAWGPAGHGLRRAASPEDAGRLARSLARQAELVRTLAATGGLVPSSQALASFVLPTRGLHDELARWVELGVPAARALAIATGSAAHVARRPDLGVLRAGAVADLVLVAGEPERALGDLARVVGVVRDGRWIPRAAMDAEAARTHARWSAEAAAARSIARRDGGVEEAIAAHRVARAADPEAPFLGLDTMERCVELLGAVGRRGDALLLVDYALELVPDDALLHLRRAQLLARSQPDEARAEAARALALRPDLVEARQLLAEPSTPTPAKPRERAERSGR